MRRVKIGLGVALMAVVGVYVLFPLYWLVVASTKNTKVLFHSSTFAPASGGSLLANLSSLFTFGGGIFRYWIVNSAIYGLVVAGLATYFASLTGYALAKYRFVGRGAMTATVVGSLMVPATVLIVPIFILEHFLHLTNSYEGVILPLLVFPFGVYFMSIYANEALPSSLLDAGRVDGAGEFRLVHKIAFPMMMPGMVTMFLISFIGTWNNYFLPLVLLGNQKLFPLTVGLSIWLSEIHSAGVSQPLYPEVILGSLISVLPMLILFPFLQKYIARGLTFGALTAE